MLSRTGLLATVLVMATGSAGLAQNLATLRDQVQTVCLNDVMTVCSEFIPDEDQIMRCMLARRPQLSPPCRQAFDSGMKSARKLRRH